MRRISVIARPFRIVTLRFSLLVLAVGLAGISGQAKSSMPPATATFYGIGDLPGGPIYSSVRDAVKHNGVIYAVGGSDARASSCVQGPTSCQPDTAVLWTFDGSNAVLTPIPDLVTNTTATGPFVVAAAITPDAQYIAGQLRNAPVAGTSVAARITTAGLSAINLNVSPYTAFSPLPGIAAMSADGMVLYGGTGGRAVRFDIGSGSALIPLLSPGHTQNGVALRGTSSDGSVMVGASGVGGNTLTFRAYRYVHGTGVSAIPLRPGGTTNSAVAVSPDGSVTLVSSPSSSLPKGEVYLHNAATNAITPLGSPNTAWQPATFGGMNADGSVVGMTFMTSAPGVFARDAYIRNGNGWFGLQRVLAAAGVPIGPDWDALAITGISPDGTLVFGAGRHNGNIEGFVAEFPPDFLADFDVPAVPPADTRIVGAWLLADDPDVPAAEQNPVILMFLADGTYFHIEANVPLDQPGNANGFERGRYTWDSTTGAFGVTTLMDTNGEAGLSAAFPGVTAEVNGDQLTIEIPACDPGAGAEPCVNIATRIGAPAGSLVGGWFAGDPTQPDSSIVVVFLADGSFYFAQDGLSEGPGGDPNGRDGIEKGTWLWNAATKDLSLTTTVDTNGQWGLNFTFPLPGSTSLTAEPSPDGWRTLLSAGAESALVSRVAVATADTPIGATIVAPTTGSGDTPVTIQFETVTGGGTTTLEVIDPAAVPADQALPSGFTLGDPPVYFEITTTATFSGPVTVCFSYAGVTFPGGVPRLLHFDDALDTWVDITTTVDASTSTVCGLTSTFSPFAIASSQTTHSGFAAPVSPVGGFQNAVKGGSTVPLKFNLFINGTEKTDTGGLLFSVVEVGCSASAGETPVSFLTTGGTSLRYTGGQFVQNWKTPQLPGCYLVRMTGDGILLSALFNVK